MSASKQITPMNPWENKKLMFSSSYFFFSQPYFCFSSLMWATGKPLTKTALCPGKKERKMLGTLWLHASTPQWAESSALIWKTIKRHKSKSVKLHRRRESEGGWGGVVWPLCVCVCKKKKRGNCAKSTHIQNNYFCGSFQNYPVILENGEWWWMPPKLVLTWLVWLRLLSCCV